VIDDPTEAAELYPGVITKATVQYVELPFGAGHFALLTLDNASNSTKPNTIGPGGLAALAATLDEVELEQVVGLGITGRPDSFAAGADLTAVKAITTREQGLALGRAGHHVFRRLGVLGVPTFAFYNGAALGGGLELGLHCAYRTVSNEGAGHRPARVLPRPGAGLGRHATPAESHRGGRRRHHDH
jgi:enoyl-CoA hydratase/carnithine racemase